MKGALGMEHLSLKSFSAEGLWGGLIYRGPLKYMLSKALAWVSVSIGVPLLGNMEGRSFYRDCDIKKYIKKYVIMSFKQVSVSIGAPLGSLEGICLPGLSGYKKIIYLCSFLGPSGH
jgi:hypothetical protein